MVTVFPVAHMNSAMDTFRSQPQVDAYRKSMRSSMPNTPKRPAKMYIESALISEVNSFQKTTPSKLSMYDKQTF